MIWFLSRFVQNLVRSNHIIHYIAFRDLKYCKCFAIILATITVFFYLLGPKLLRCRQVLPVVVSQMIIADYTGWFYTSGYQEINQNTFQFCLTGLEVVPGNKNACFLCKVNYAWYECVLG